MAGAIVQPTALILGAGFSRWATGLPVAETLFDFRITPLNSAENGRLARLREAKRRWNSDNPGGLAEQFVAHMLQVGERNRRIVLWYLTRRLSEPFIATVLGGRQTLMIDDSRAGSLRGVRRAHRFLERLSVSPISGIVTPNYDVLVEYALGTRGFDYGTTGEVLYGRGKNPVFPWQGAWPVLCGDLPIAKIHGSLSWTEDTKYTDARCGLRGNALIVPPHAGKGQPQMLEQTRHLAERILNSSFRAIVFGFGFNSYDEHLLSLFAHGGRHLRDVLIIDVAPNAEAAKKVWPDARISTSAPPPRGDRDIAVWIQNRHAVASHSA